MNKNTNGLTKSIIDTVNSVSIFADNQSFVSVCKGGTINLHTGEFFYFNDDINVGGVVFPFVLSHYYRSNNYSQFNEDWHLSIDQSLLVYQDPATLEAYYIDGLGDYHLFNHNEGNNFSNDDMILECDYSENSTDDCIITDRKGNKLFFDDSHKLYKICDKNNNSILITKTNKNSVSTIQICDSFGRKTEIVYESQNLTRIIDSSHRITEFVYENSKLKEILYPDGTKTEFINFPFYDSYGIIKENDGMVYTFEKRDNKYTRVKKYSAYSDITVDAPEEFIEIEYVNEHKTIVKDRSGIRKVYLFDDNGRALNIYEDVPLVIDGVELEDRHEIKGAVSYRYTNKKKTFSCVLDQNDESINLLTNGSFENDLEGWSLSTTCVDTDNVRTSDSINDGKSFVFTTFYKNNMSDKKYLKQNVSLNNFSWSSGNTLLLSGWAKLDEGYLDLRAVLNYTDNSSEEFKVSFDRSIQTWNYVSLPIVKRENIDVDSIDIYVESVLYHVGNRTFVDNFRLVNAAAKNTEYIKDIEELLTVFDYTETIKEKVVINDGIYTIEQSKNENYDIVKTTIIDADGNAFCSYAQYDDKHQLIYSQDYRGIITKYTYNSVGMVTSVKTWHCTEMNPSAITEPSQYFLKTMEYDETGEFLVRENDPRGDYIYTANEYDTTKCLLQNTTAPNGQKTSYTYDSNNDLVTKVSALVGENEYSVLYGYTNRRLTSITHNGFDYGFTYDGMGRAKDVKIAGETYSTNDYLLTDTTTVTTTYATGEKMKEETDRFNQPIKTTYIDADENSEVLLETEYDSLGRVTKAIDNVELMTYNYKYDGFGNVINSSGGNLRVTNTFDSSNRLSEKLMEYGGEDFVITPTYEKDLDGKIYPDNVITGLTYDNGVATKIKRDEYGRVTEKQVDFGENFNVITENYRYLKVPNDDSFLLTNMVRGITYNHGGEEETIQYTYDNNGNITAVTKGFDVLVRYEYDEMNQLIREDNKQLNRSFLYKYDNAGNIILKDEHEYILGEHTATLSHKEYTYSDTGWKDKLISFGGQSITYDALGNPLSYLGHNLTWDRVRQLKNFDNNTFDYNAFGKRSRKNGVYYLYDGNQLIKERRNGTSLVYFYDTTGVCGFRYHDFAGENDTTEYYFYRKNLQGDVTAILDQNGNIVAKYLYDAWGKCSITYDPTGIGAINPIRYRSYYYDIETGLYYLNSRYYDPNTGRFINVDSTGALSVSLMDLYNKNLYAYCDNNPVVRADFGGTFWHIVVGAVIGAVVSGIVSTVSMIVVEKDFVLGKFITSVAVGAFSGGMTAFAPGYSVAISSGSSAIESIITDCIDGKDVTTVVTDAVISAGLGAVSGSWGDDISNPNLYDDALDSISKIKPGNHPNVKNNAKKIIKEAAKQAKKTAVNELVTSSSMEMIGIPTKKVTLCYVNMIY